MAKEGAGRNLKDTFTTFIAVVTLIALWSAPSASPVNDVRACLISAYPNYLKGPVDDSGIVSHAGKVYPFDGTTQYVNFHDELNRADLHSQLRQRYPLGELPSAPRPGNDPGRLRHTPLFASMYGVTPDDVTRNLTGVHWAPCNCEVKFSRVNGASVALEEVGRAISLAGLSHYVARPSGTFNWRFIAGTQRLSPHAFGIAIDFALPDGLARYWRWDPNPDRFPIVTLRDEGLNQVVALFEQHGFIWGGKWGHYDSVHFEYRPELTNPSCASTTP